MILLACGMCLAELDISSTNIKSARTAIEIGEPLTIEVVRKYHNPDNVIRASFAHTMRIVVENTGENGEPPSFIERPSNFRRDLEKGEYMCTLDLWYELWGKKPAQLCFPTPGKYKVYIKAYPSSVLNVNVVPTSDKTRKAVSLLADPKDRYFLMDGEDNETRDARIAKLSEVVNQCENTLLGQIAAGRLGLEYYEDFYEKNRNLNDFRAKLKESGFEDPLLNKAEKYLAMAGGLPDDMPIREEVLYRYLQVEYTKGNDTKAMSIFDEFLAKYPLGDFGKKAAAGKVELQKIMDSELTQARQTEGPVDDADGKGKYVIAGIIAIFIFGLALFVRGKKKKEK